MIRSSLTALILACVLAAPALAQPASRPPTIHGTAEARSLVARYLRRDYAAWTFRDSGSIDCAGGRVGRSVWRCRIHLRHNEDCWAGRATVWGFLADGRQWFQVRAGWRRCG